MHHPLEAVTLPMENLKYDGGRIVMVIGIGSGLGEGLEAIVEAEASILIISAILILPIVGIFSY